MTSGPLLLLPGYNLPSIVFEQHIPHFLLACGVSCFLHLAHMTWSPSFPLVGVVECAAGLLPVEVIMVGFFTVREFHKLWPMAPLRKDGYLPQIPI